MEIKTIEPRDCTKWKFANRSSFEYGSVNDLADDIKKNGQIEPIYVRKLSKGKQEKSFILQRSIKRFSLM